VAIVSLGLGIGANAAIFSLFDQMILRALPVQDPGRLVNLPAPGPKPGSQSSNNAGRWQLVRQRLVESCLLALFGGLAGALFSVWTLDAILSMMPADAATTIQPGIDARVMLFAAALTLGTGLLFGLFPALHSTRPDLVSALKGQSGQPGGSRSASRFRTSLATFQIALSMALLASSGLFLRSLVNVSRVDLGLNATNVVTFGLSPQLNAYTHERSRALFERLEEELAAVPGVSGVTASVVPVLAGSNWGEDVEVEGFEKGPDTDDKANYIEAGPAYFRTLGVLDRYSWLRAATGSMRVARRAGIMHAATATVPRSIAAIASTPGSLSRTP